MTKTLVAFAAVLLLSAAPAVAAEWPSFKSIDTNGNGQIDSVEWRKNSANLKVEQVPTFEAMDANSTNSIDEDEWAAAEKLSQSYAARCREASSSWCKDAK